MTESAHLSAISHYLQLVADAHKGGNATEHTYRPFLKQLIETLGETKTEATNEPSQSEVGAPDFVVDQGGVPIGHIECKDVHANLGRVARTDQLERYQAGLPNLILTDYLEFHWFVDGELRAEARLGRLKDAGGYSMDHTGVDAFLSMVGQFFKQDLPTVSSAQQLARRMAAKARLLNDSISEILDQQDSSGRLQGLLKAYREVLIADLQPQEFADLQAQTAAYGLFAARCSHQPNSGEFTRQAAVFAKTTPFLQQVFQQIAGVDIDDRIGWIVDDLARLLDRADMSAILKDFGSRTTGQDPVVHFYEDFLAAYDPELKAKRGVYYTPEPVVSYIVRSVDHFLRERFGLADGLADTEMVSCRKANGEVEKNPRVLILDPSAGTGTFLREVIANVRDTIYAKGLAGTWSQYVDEHLLPRLFGFELLMAPYAICHLKLALELSGEDAGLLINFEQRLNVFLTNTLEEPHHGSTAQGALFAQAIAEESASADAVKRDKPVMVVLGNPPYSGHSSNNGQYIHDLLHGKDGEEATGNYFAVNGQPLGEANPKWLNDDYVKFIRYAQRRIERAGEGILAFVTNHSYLDGPTFRGMRQSLLDTFDELYIVDLHGNTRRRERAPDGSKDENPFDIQQGVAIGLFVKLTQSLESTPCRVYQTDLWGLRDSGDNAGKYQWLREHDVASTSWKTLTPSSPWYLLVPRDDELAEEYEAGWSVRDVFPVHSAGIVTARDELTIQRSQDDIRKVASDFLTRSVDDARSHYHLRRDSKDWNVPLAQEDLRSHPDADKHVTSVLYRLFDTRWTYYTGKSRGFICRPRDNVMRHMLSDANLGLVTCRQQSQTGVAWSHCFVSRTIVESSLVSNKTREISSVFPLYLSPSEADLNLQLGRKPNLKEEFIRAVSERLHLRFDDNGPGNLVETLGPEDLLHYFYAVLHSPMYRSRYADFLKSDFPRVSLTSSRPLFAELVELGERLTALHLMDSFGSDQPSFPQAGSNEVRKIEYSPPVGDSNGRVYINRDQFFEGVSEQSWGFTIGGYQPTEKWLKDREGRNLSFDEINHYRHICAAMSETPVLMAAIDDAIDSHGGWPLS